MSSDEADMETPRGSPTKPTTTPSRRKRGRTEIVSPHRDEGFMELRNMMVKVLNKVEESRSEMTAKLDTVLEGWKSVMTFEDDLPPKLQQDKNTLLRRRRELLDNGVANSVSVHRRGILVDEKDFYHYDRKTDIMERKPNRNKIATTSSSQNSQ
jgi:hypothetical protein